ncbi:uncharacterized protein LOC120413914 isoform X1 [Culex pipiens pallens]|uniref:uncharacterized protein LOC120413914 isoform X1 n=1 Tax=Culex pipiens pallens TaxID=42434 RepID=UPI0022AB0775|nr:uncharacterized protein LOC120413914 isoform X1 [Culex pipiens pallens]
MGETKLLHILLLGLCCQISGAGRISFPDSSGRSAEPSSRSTSTSSRQSEFEGRSIRGGSSQSHLRPEYSRYNVYEHEQNDFRPPSTTTPHPYGSTTRQVYNPNAFFNRLPPSKNDEPIQAEEEDDYDEEEDGVILGTEPPPSSERPSADYSSGGSNGARPVAFNNLFYGLHNDKFAGFGNLFGEDRRKHRYKFKRRRPGQPCIPYDLFLNKLRSGRDFYGNRIDPKTLIPPLNLVLADVNYFAPHNNYNGQGGGSYASDTASDSTGSNGGAVFNNHFYDAVGGYPCTGGYQKPHRPHGGPLGFFGQGGLFDWTSSADNIQSDEGGGSSNKPAVVFNLNDAIDSVATNWRPGESFQMMMKVIAEFISSVAGGGGALPIADAGGALVDAVDTVRNVNKEFVSLFSG